MTRGPVNKETFIYTLPPRKFGLDVLTADSTVNSKLASEEGFDRIVFMLLSVILKRKWTKCRRNFSVPAEMRRMVVPAKQLLSKNNFMNTDEAGGWPLSVFLTPDGKPFYGGTYFPPKDIYGRPGFDRVLLSIADAWKNRRQELVDSSHKISEVLASLTGPAEKETLSPDMLQAGFDYFRSTFDATNGGFGPAPKFPQPTNLSMLLSYWHRTNDTYALQMVEKTLDAMAIPAWNLLYKSGQKNF